MAQILQSSSQFKITRTLEMRMCDAKACVKKTATPGSSRWIPPCSYSSFLITHLLWLPHRIVTWVHLHAAVKICGNGEDTVLTLALQEDVHQGATKFPVSWHQVSLLLCDFSCQQWSKCSQLRQNRINANNSSICSPLTTDKSVPAELKIDLPCHHH